MQMITEVGAEQNTTTIVMMPSEFVSMAGRVADWAGAHVQRQANNGMRPLAEGR